MVVLTTSATAWLRQYTDSEDTVGSVSQAPCWEAHADFQFPAGFPNTPSLPAAGLLPVTVTLSAEASR